jgi:hypothetical protein
MIHTMEYTPTLKTYSEVEVDQIVSVQPDGKNTKFLKASHSLWIRFKNYDKNPPFVLENEDGIPVALVFATYSQRTKYINLYEIVTVEGAEGRGYASEIWKLVMEDAYDNGMRRLKISCTPSSVSWHMRNGLVFWAVDPTGSLRSDQPLYRTREEQLEFREKAIQSPTLALPDNPKVLEQLKNESLESHGFGKRKTETVTTAIDSVGKYWLRDALFNTVSLEAFF